MFETVSDWFEMDFLFIHLAVERQRRRWTLFPCIDFSIIIRFYSILSDRKRFPPISLIIYLEILIQHKIFLRTQSMNDNAIEMSSMMHCSLCIENVFRNKSQQHSKRKQY